MANYEKDNRIAIWKNENREKDTHPHYRGQGMANGVEVWAAAWRAGENASPNAPVLTIELTPKDQAPTKAAPAKKEAEADIPF